MGAEFIGRILTKTSAWKICLRVSHPVKVKCRLDGGCNKGRIRRQVNEHKDHREFAEPLAVQGAVGGAWYLSVVRLSRQLAKDSADSGSSGTGDWQIAVKPAFCFTDWWPTTSCRDLLWRLSTGS